MSAAGRPPVETGGIEGALRSRLAPVPDRATPAPEPEPAAAEPPEEPGEQLAGSVGRAGKGKVNKLVYAPAETMAALFTFADDVHHGSRGKVHRWEVIHEVITTGLAPGARKRILRKLAPAMLPKEGE